MQLLDSPLFWPVRKGQEGLFQIDVLNIFMNIHTPLCLHCQFMDKRE